MSAFTFLTAQEIAFGRGTAATAARRVGELGRAALLVHGATPSRSDWLRRDLAEAGVEVASFACPKEPDIDLIEAGVDAARRAGAAAVVAVGGGAVIDAGKAVAALATASGPALDYLEVVGRGATLDAPPLPFVAIPTTAGTGAEATKNAVILAAEARRKVSLRDPRMLPKLAIVDPALTDGAPRAVTLGSGLDAITQVVEPYISCKANRLTDALCRDAVPKGLRALARLMREEDAAARDDMAWTSLCGGLALANAGLGAVHGLAGVIGGRYPNAPHGAVCGALLPHVLRANETHVPPESAAAERLAQIRRWIARALDAEERDAFDWLERWSCEAGLPGLASLGFDLGDAAKIAAAAESSSSMRGNPVRLDPAALVHVLEAAA